MVRLLLPRLITPEDKVRRPIRNNPCGLHRACLKSTLVKFQNGWNTKTSLQSSKVLVQQLASHLVPVAMVSRSTQANTVWFASFCRDLLISVATSMPIACCLPAKLLTQFVVRRLLYVLMQLLACDCRAMNLHRGPELLPRWHLILLANYADSELIMSLWFVGRFSP